MNSVIYKFVVKALHSSEGLELPVGAQVLSIGLQKRQLYKVVMWVALDPDCTETETRYFYFVGTGSTLPNSEKKFIGTVQDSSEYVWHVFEGQYEKLSK